MTFEEFKPLVIGAAQAAGLKDYELYYAAAESVSVSAFQHEVKEFSSSLEGGVSFRCLVNGRMGYASTERLDAEAAASLVRRAAENAASLETEEQEFLAEGGKEYRSIEREGYALPEAADLVKTALEGQNALYAADPAVVDGCESEALTARGVVAIVNSRGLDLKSENAMAGFVSAAVVSDGKEMSDSYKIYVGDPAKMDVPALAGKAVKEAKAKLGADVAPTGNYPVVFAGKAMASLLQTFASVFSAETARKGLSRLLGKEGEKIAADCVTLTDDPFYPESAAPRAFDGEGNPTYTKNVIENGELMTLLHNMKSAAALGKETTGNAARASYDAAVDVRPFTFYLAPGPFSEAELLQKAGNGVYIDSLGGLHAGANPISGDFSLQSAGYMIEGGEKTRAVKSFTVAGNFYELLKSITAVADAVKLENTGSVTTFASPDALVEGLSIAGK